MYKIKIINNKSKQQTHGAQFESLTEAQSWIALCESNQSWGLPERWLADTPMNPLSEEEKAKAKNKRKVEVMGEEVEEYFFEADYQIDVKDITAEVQAEKAAKEAKKLAKEKRKADRKAVDWSKNLTTKQLQEIVKSLVEDKED